MSTLTGANSYCTVANQSYFSYYFGFISKAFLAMGWKQTTDQGQVQWPTSSAVLTQVAVSGGNAVYTYDATFPNFYGAALVVGMPISIAGFTTAGNNVTNQLITALGGSGATSTFTVATTTQVNETHAAVAAVGVAVNCSQVAVSGGNAVYTYNAAAISGGTSALRVGFPVQVTGFTNAGNNVSNRPITALGGSGASSTFTVAATTQVNETHAALVVINSILFVQATIPTTWNGGCYEIFQSNDSFSATTPITVRFDYASAGSNIPKMWFQFGLGGTNGSGNLSTPCTTGGGSHVSSVSGSDNTILRNNYASGDAGNMRFLLTAGPSTGPSFFTFFCIGRSYDQNGNQTDQYVQMWTAAQSSNTQQAIFGPTHGSGMPPPEFANWIALCGQTTSQSQGFGGIVAVSPCYQVVGGFGNPSPDLALVKNVDFPDGVLTNVSFYGVNHTYIASTSPKSFIPGSNQGVLMRFE